MQKTKSTNYHDFDHELFLGFTAQQPLAKPQIDVSYIGGHPLWLYEPNPKLLRCSQCTDESLTFLAQIFCPLNAKHTYNRVMYVFFCEKCKRQFRCIKQQTDQNWQPKAIQVKQYKVVTQQAFEIESDTIQRKQLLKIINRAKLQVQQEIIMQEEDQNDDDDEQGEEVVTIEKMTGEQMVNRLDELQKAKKNREYTEKEIQDINRKFQSLKVDQKDEKQGGEKEIHEVKRDHVFEQYVKVLKSIKNPIMIYSNIAVPYNKLPLNPKHQCKYCANKLELEIQFTEQILLFNKTLAVLDWGSIFVYACTASCQQSEDECVVLQYELDAISQDEIAKLKKTKKTRRKNKNKSLSKEKNKLLGEKEKQKIQPELIKSSLKQQDDDEKDEDGDWD